MLQSMGSQKVRHIWAIEQQQWRQYMKLLQVITWSKITIWILDLWIRISRKGKVCCWCSVTKSCPTLCNPMYCSTPGFPVVHYLLELAQTHVHWVGDAIQPSHPVSCPSLPTFNLSLHQDLFKWISSLHQVAKVLKLQLQHQSFQRIFRIDFIFDWLVGSSCNPGESQEFSTPHCSKA